MSPKEPCCGVSPPESGGWLARLPRLHAGVFLAVVLVCLFQVCSFDIFWHLRIGQIFWQTGQVFDHNRFSWTFPQFPWTPTYWLFEALVYPVFHLGGAPALVLMRGLVLAVCWASLAACFRSARTNPWLLLLVFVAAVDVSLFRFMLRPHVFSYLGLALLICALKSCDDAGRGTRALWFTPLLFLVWTNLHSGVVFGFAYFGLFLAGRAGDVLGRSLRRGEGSRALWRDPLLRCAALAFAGSLLGCLVNPTGWHFFAYVYDHLTMDTVIPVEELAPFSPLRHPKTAFVVLWFTVLPLPLLLRARRLRWAPVLHAAFSLALLSKGLRFVPIACLFSLPAVFRAMDSLPGRPRAGLSGKGCAEGGRRRVGWVALNLVLPLAYAAHVHWNVYRLPECTFSSGLDFHPASFPIEACEAMPGAVEAGLYNSFSAGGYVVWRFAEQVKVFQDGRIHAYPPSFFKRVEGLRTTRENCRRLLEEFGITRLLVSKTEDPVLAALAADSAPWRVVHEDRHFLYAEAGP